MSIRKSFNPHTHEGCDFALGNINSGQAVSIHTPTKGVTQCAALPRLADGRFNPHTHEGCDSDDAPHQGYTGVSIHTPTKGVTAYSANS